MDDIKSVKGLPFSGKREDFQLWQFKFLSFCSYQKCKAVLVDPNIILPPHTAILDKEVPADAIKLDIRAQNAKAYMF
jgi:hypothetical protein